MIREVVKYVLLALFLWAGFKVADHLPSKWQFDFGLGVMFILITLERAL